MKFAIKFIISFVVWQIAMFYLMRLFINIDFALHVYTLLGKAYHAFYTHVVGIFLAVFLSLFTANIRWWRR